MNLDSKLHLAGHRGLGSSAIWKNLQEKGFTNLVGKTSSALILTDQNATKYFFEAEKKEFVFLVATYIGGITGNNTYRTDLITKNLQLKSNVISVVHQFGVNKLMLFGSTSIYPRDANLRFT